MKIPLVDLAAQQREVDDEVRAGLDDVFATTAFIGGPAVAEFEAAYARLIGVQHCIGVANGTDALELALRGAGVCRGGEVILPANTFIATAEAVVRIGAVPVLVDVDPVHQLIDPALVESAIGENTQAIVPVHLFGQVAPVRASGRHGGRCRRGGDRRRRAVAGSERASAARPARWARFPGPVSTRARTSGQPAMPAPC